MIFLQVHGKCTGVRIKSSLDDTDQFVSEVSFPDPSGLFSIRNFLTFAVDGRLELGQDVRMTIEVEVEDKKET